MARCRAQGAAGLGSCWMSTTWSRWSKKLKDDGVTFRNDIVEGPGGKQILCTDPAGNVVELFQPVPLSN